MRFLLSLAVLFNVLMPQSQASELIAHPFLIAGIPAQDSVLRDSIGEVVVIAQRREERLFFTPGAVELLNGKALRARQARTVPEALVATSGVFNQSTSRSGSPFLRGLTGNQTLLLIDGIRLNNSTFRYGPNQYLNTIDPFSIDRMEVWKGGGSVAYGTDALGGTIQVLTQEPRFSSEGADWSGRAMGQFISQGMEQSGRLEGMYSGENTAILAGVTLRHFGDLIGGDTTGRQNPSGYDEMAFDAKGKFRLGDNHFLTVAHQYFRQEEQPVFHKIQLENFLRNHFTEQQRQLTYARWQHQPTGKKDRFSATLSLQNTIEGRESQKKGSSVLTEEQDKVRTLGATFQYECAPGTHLRLSSGLEFYQDLVHSTRVDINLISAGLASSKRGLYPDGSTHLSAAVYTLASWELQKWQFTGGARYNYFAVTTKDEVNGEVTIKPDALVGNFSALYGLTPKDNVFASIESAFRAPNIDDMGTLGIVDFRYEVPAFDLTPESSLNMELGYRHRSAKVQAEVFLFRNELRDLIARVRLGNDSIAGYPVYIKENVQEGYIHGVEGDFNVAVTSRWNVQGALSWQYGQNVSRNEPQRRIPPMFGRGAVSYAHNGLSITAETLFASKQDRLAAGDKSDNRIPAGGTPGWAVFNLYGAYSWNAFTVRAGFWNIGNEDYRYHGSGTNAMGRSASLAIEVGF
ncbi:MAG: TonB-dependent receptor [Haliscomenobacter sp.]|nr:TonB-dependent receptor [Haliscomenobacter sp.]